MGGFKQFHHFVSLAAIFKPRWWAFVTRAPCFFKKVVPFTHLTLNWSCNPGERNSWSWHFLGDMLINCYTVNTFLKNVRLSPRWLHGHSERKILKHLLRHLDKICRNQRALLSYWYALWGGRGVLLCLDQILNKTMVAHAWYDPCVRNQRRNLSTNWPKSHFYSWQPIWALKCVRKRFDGS